MAERDLIVETECGLYCPAGDFYVDAWKGVARNIVTHAHADHARVGSERYLAAREGVGLLRHRLGAGGAIDGVEYGERVMMNGVAVSLHPAGHVLGSAQVRIEKGGEVWAISGDYKREADATCRGFEVVGCDTFVTECTFGLPVFRWGDSAKVAGEINSWWKENCELRWTSIVGAYALGKSQRLLAGLDASIGPILLHGAVHGVTEVYRAEGVALPPAEYATDEMAKAHKGRALVIAPPTALGSTWVRKFGAVSTGFASGWMQVRGFRRRQMADRGFVLSDHVDFPALLKTIDETGARRVIATHGYTEALVKLMRERGKEAGAFATRFGEGEEEGGVISN